MQVVGRVERVGWGQTRIRGRDTRPTYVPNAHFVQTAVTNMERITHRKFEATVPIRFSDYALMNDVINRIKDRLKNIAKLDVLSMPFRVSFVRVGSYCLEIEITCYFATKSIDEYLALQQVRWILMMDGLVDALMIGWMVAWMDGVFILSGMIVIPLRLLSANVTTFIIIFIIIIIIIVIIYHFHYHVVCQYGGDSSDS
jgi:hypothetical protein